MPPRRPCGEHPLAYSNVSHAADEPELPGHPRRQRCGGHSAARATTRQPADQRQYVAPPARRTERGRRPAGVARSAASRHAPDPTRRTGCARPWRWPSSRFGLSDPNPRVGCVIGREDGRVLGRGYTQEAGGPHAEIVALRDAQARRQRRARRHRLGHAGALRAPRPHTAVLRRADRRRRGARRRRRRRPFPAGGRRRPRAAARRRHRASRWPTATSRTPRANSTSASSRACSAAGPGCG